MYTDLVERLPVLNRLGEQTLTRHRCTPSTECLSDLQLTLPLCFLCLLHQRVSFSFAVFSFHSYPSSSIATWGQQPEKTRTLPVLVAQWPTRVLFAVICPWDLQAQWQTKPIVKVKFTGRQYNNLSLWQTSLQGDNKHVHVDSVIFLHSLHCAPQNDRFKQKHCVLPVKNQQRMFRL